MINLLATLLLLLASPCDGSTTRWWIPGPNIPHSSFKLVTVEKLTPNSFSAAENNTQILQKIIGNAQPGNTVIIPAVSDGGVYWLAGGNTFQDLHNVTLDIQAEFRAVTACFDGCWPKDAKGKNFLHFFQFSNSTHLTIHGNGRIDGSGKGWWNRYTIGNHSHSSRPKMFVFNGVSDLLIHDLTFVNSPSFNILLKPVLRAEIKNVTVITDRAVVRQIKSTMAATRRRLTLASNEQLASSGSYSSTLQPEDLNTDGIDPMGRDIFIHDCNIQNDDDSIAVKPLSNDYVGDEHLTCTENVLIENTRLTGFGASIGSVPPHPDHNCVRNITFRNISMPGTGKGIYIKSNPTCAADGSKTAEITNILYEHVDIKKPLWFSIWIGPQQQHEPGSSLGNKCALIYPLFNTKCPTQSCVDFRNITLRNVTITDPLLSPGVILGNATNKMSGIIFENVEVINSGSLPFGKGYQCKNAIGVSTGTTHPVPSCFSQQ